MSDKTKEKGKTMKNYYTIALEEWVDGKRSKIISETKPMTKMEFIVSVDRLYKNFHPLTAEYLFEQRTYAYKYNAKTNEKIKEKRLQ